MQWRRQLMIRQSNGLLQDRVIYFTGEQQQKESMLWYQPRLISCRWTQSLMMTIKTEQAITIMQFQNCFLLVQSVCWWVAALSNVFVSTEIHAAAVRCLGWWKDSLVWRFFFFFSSSCVQVPDNQTKFKAIYRERNTDLSQTLTGIKRIGQTHTHAYSSSANGSFTTKTICICTCVH